MSKSETNGKPETAKPEIKVERSRLVLLGALAATTVAVVGCGNRRNGVDGAGYGD